MSRTAGGRFGQENELQRSLKEPVTYPAGAGQNLTDRLGQDAHAMRSSNPVRILKWVRTNNVAQFESPVVETTENSELIPNAEPAGEATAPVESAPLEPMPEAPTQNDQGV
ncbi:hypothetical protein MEQU1_003337 [Malassezia equina]|uniref:Uncharacterized protein n=1 Tax=Malassezia equina TaxID=1381935 RepID=A0AAF0EFT1_9BASI|nr:hypothetical protein MEQU1_003337 [Malassezia equina]